MTSYTVKKGDTLSDIAKQYGTTYQEIAKANNIADPNKIYEGQTLKIGSDTPTTQQPTQAPTVTAPTQSTEPWSYDEFKASDNLKAMDQNRQNHAAQKPSNYTYTAYDPSKSDLVKQAKAMLQEHLAQKPGAYQYSWQTQLDDALNKILNREKFSYDLNGDALYQQYKDQYTLQGQQAMMDTMGQAAALTGGYGNSYAQTVGQQTYQGYMQQLNDKIPELYQLALDQYNREGEDLYNQYALHADRENKEYSRYQDQLNEYYNELQRLMDNEKYERNTDYSHHMDEQNMLFNQNQAEQNSWQNTMDRLDQNYWNQYNAEYGQYSDDRNLSYGQYRDQVSDSQWDQSFQYQQDRDKVSDEQWQAQFDEAKRQYDQDYALSQEKLYSRDTGSDPDSTPTPIEEPEEAIPTEQPKPTTNTSKFIAKMGKETKNWDAIARHQYGSEKTYIAQQVENSSMTEDEKAFLIYYYGITENDLNYKKGHS